MGRVAATGQQPPDVGPVLADARVDHFERVQHLLAVEQGAGVFFQGVVFLALANGSDGFEGETKGFHERLAGGGLAGKGVAIVWASSDQLCSVNEPWSMAWRKNVCIGSCR